MKIEIRYAKLEDAARLVEIYCYYVEKTAITFEYEVPAVEEVASEDEKTVEAVETPKEASEEKSDA